MITKIRSFQDTWLVKGILILTALSFMSLFGISGYVGYSNRSHPIIKVNDFEVAQDEINHLLDKQIRTYRYLFGANGEISDEIRNAMLQEIVQKQLRNAILEKTAQRNSVVISDDLLRKIIQSMPEFADAEGNFDINKMRQILNLDGNSEKEFINSVRNDIITGHLVGSVVNNIEFPHVADKYWQEISGQRKIFEYVVIDPDKLKIDRKISEDEVEQYYQDFASQFEDAENRDVAFFELKAEDLAKTIIPDDSEIDNYYQEHLEQFVIPEKRQVLQMVFDDEKTAEKAYAQLKKGISFKQTAKDIAKQSAADTDLGEVSKDMLIADVSDVVFDLQKGQYTKPIKSDMGWHIMQVKSVSPQKETKLTSVKNKIIEILRNEQAYDVAVDVVNDIEDSLGAGKTFEDIAHKYHAPIYHAKGIKEDASVKKVADKFKNMVSSDDFVDTVFSYNKGETSQIIETETGFALIKIEDIHDVRQKSIGEVKAEINELWAKDERNAIAQELVNDISHDLENGDNFAEVTKRFELNMKTTKALAQGQSFAGLSPMQLKEIYRQNLNEAKIFEDESRTVIVVPVKAMQANEKLSDKDKERLHQQLNYAFEKDLADELVKAYGRDYKIKVNYKNIGLNDHL